MPAITMKADAVGSLDGITSKEFKAGETYNLTGPQGEAVAKTFVAEGLATDAAAKPAEPTKKPPAKPGPAETTATKPDETKEQ